ncbi:hypothetical protein [Butyrivibrio sp. JL13D10]|uniref:hypothetical protein n=1 Tax=Butyrivibrio sp. JL13D10 TaxID=3236815 RepID=UPI0038B5710B
MADSRKFMIEFQKAKDAAGRYESVANDIRKYADAIVKLGLKVRGDPGLDVSCATIVTQADQLRNISRKIWEQGSKARGCIEIHENAEKQLERAASEFISRKKGISGAAPGIQFEKKNNKLNVDAKLGGKVNASVPQGLAEKADKPPDRCCWRENFYYIDKQGRIWHFGRAYINSKGVPTAYRAKTGVTGRTFLNSFTKNERGERRRLKETFKGGKASDGTPQIYDREKKQFRDNKFDWKNGVYKDGKWLSKEEIAEYKDTFTKKIGTIAEVDAVSAEGEATRYGAEVEGSALKGCVKGSASAKFLTADFSANAGVGAYVVKDKDGKQYMAYGLNARAGGSANVARATAKGTIAVFDERLASIDADIDVKALGASAEAGACFQYIPGKGYELAIKGEAAIYLVDIKGSIGGTILGIRMAVNAAFQVGAGIKGNIGFKNGKFQFEFGAAAGIGFTVGATIDFSGVVTAVEDLIDWIVDKNYGSQPYEARIIKQTAKQTMKKVVKDATKRAGEAVCIALKILFRR